MGSSTTDFLDVLIDVGDDNVEKVISILFYFDGKDYFQDSEDDYQTPDEIIFRWCTKNAESVMWNSKILSMVFGIIVPNNPKRCKSFDLKRVNTRSRLFYEHTSWCKCVLYDTYVNKAYPKTLWRACWNEIMISAHSLSGPKSFRA